VVKQKQLLDLRLLGELHGIVKLLTLLPDP
jgi:hypothetical protein